LKQHIFLSSLVKAFHTKNHPLLPKKIKFKKKYNKYTLKRKQINTLKKFKFTFFLKKNKHSKNITFKSTITKNRLSTRQFFLAKSYNAPSLSVLKHTNLFLPKRLRLKQLNFLKKNKKQTLFAKKFMSIAMIKNQNPRAHHKPNLLM
jgi:hypothetical protein